MAKHAYPSITNNQTFKNYFATIVSLVMLLYLLGISGIVTLGAGYELNQTKEAVAFFIELEDDANEGIVFAFQKKLEASSYVKKKTVQYITKEEGLTLLSEDEALDEEDVLLFGENLLPNIIKFSLKEAYFADYESIIQEIEQNDFVGRVFFEEAPTKNLAGKAYSIEIILLVLVIFFIFVVITLIKNTLKLLFLSNKESIRTMQMAGATIDYISKPYLQQAIKNGILSGLIAMIAVFATLYWWSNSNILNNQTLAVVIYSCLFIIIITGVLLSWLSTKHSVKKYLTQPVENWEW